MSNGTSTVAGVHAAAGAARLRARHAFGAYPWQTGSVPCGRISALDTMTTDAKSHHRWPEEPSP